MAGDFIKVEKTTARKTEIYGIAKTLGISLDHAFGLCIRFWIWCDDQISDGNAKNVTCALLDEDLGMKGFAESLVSVGWLQVRSSSLVIPNWDRHLSQTAKRRLDTNRRVANHREKKRNENVTQKTLQKPLPEKEKEKEKEFISPKPPLEIPDKTFGGTWLEPPSDDFNRWWSCLPVGMKSGEDACWKIWEIVIAKIQAKHKIDQSSSISHLVHRTKMFAVSPKGKSEQFRWSPKTFLEDGHYDDDSKSWEVVHDDRKPSLNAQNQRIRSAEEINEERAKVTGGRRL